MFSMNMNENCLQYLVGGNSGEVLQVDDCIVTITLSSHRSLVFGLLIFLTSFCALFSALQIFYIWRSERSWRFILGYQAQSWIIVGWSVLFILLSLLGIGGSNELNVMERVSRGLLIASVALLGMTLHYCVRSSSETEEEEELDDVEEGEHLKNDGIDDESDIVCPVAFPPQYKYYSDSSQLQRSLGTPLL